jgi:hypothetical protein
LNGGDGIELEHGRNRLSRSTLYLGLDDRHFNLAPGRRIPREGSHLNRASLSESDMHLDPTRQFPRRQGKAKILAAIQIELHLTTGRCCGEIIGQPKSRVAADTANRRIQLDVQY